MIDPAQQVYDALYDLLELRGYCIPVIRRRSSGPAPKGHHLMIDDSTSLLKTGTTAHGYRDPEDFQSKTVDFSGGVDLWEIGGGSSGLARFVVELDLLDSTTFLEERGVSILSVGAITPMPDLDDQNYREQFRLPLQVAIAAGVIDETLTYIESVTFTNQIQRTP